MTVTDELHLAAMYGKIDDVVRYLEEGRCHIDAKNGVNIHMLLEILFFIVVFFSSFDYCIYVVYAIGIIRNVIFGCIYE